MSRLLSHFLRFTGSTPYSVYLLMLKDIFQSLVQELLIFKNLTRVATVRLKKLNNQGLRKICRISNLISLTFIFKFVLIFQSSKLLSWYSLFKFVQGKIVIKIKAWLFICFSGAHTKHNNVITVISSSIIINLFSHWKLVANNNMLNIINEGVAANSRTKHRKPRCVKISFCCFTCRFARKIFQFNLT